MRLTPAGGAVVDVTVSDVKAGTDAAGRPATLATVTIHGVTGRWRYSPEGWSYDAVSEAGSLAVPTSLTLPHLDAGVIAPGKSVTGVLVWDTPQHPGGEMRLHSPGGVMIAGWG